MQSPKAPDATSVHRNVVVRVNSGRCTEDKSRTANIVDHRCLVRSVDLVPQPSHMHIDEVALRDEFVIPDLFEKHCPCQQLVLASHHIFKEAKFPRKQVDHPLTTL